MPESLWVWLVDVFPDRNIEATKLSVSIVSITAVDCGANKSYKRGSSSQRIHGVERNKSRGSHF